ncbi:MAG: transcriptional regulator [Halobacteriaceae archaeon]
MGTQEPTVRKKIKKALTSRPYAPSTLADEFGISLQAVLNHIEHIKRSLDTTNQQLLVRPPECEKCGFNEFDDLLNVPSRCPNCKSEMIIEPVFQIEKTS